MICSSTDIAEFILKLLARKIVISKLIWMMIRMKRVLILLEVLVFGFKSFGF